MVGKISNADDSIYLDEIERFTDWCDDNYLYLNVVKTKELCIDFKKVQCDLAPVHIKDSIVDRVNEYKCLGIKLDSKLKWVENTNFIIKKAITVYLRKLMSFCVSHDLLGVFFNAVVCSALTFGIVCCGGNLSRHEMGRLNKIIKKGSQIIGKQSESSIDSIYNKRITSKAHSVLKDPSHPLYAEFYNRRTTCN
ncbi:uncharacterized protein LOC144435552 [Glandiceps talaboti]